LVAEAVTARPMKTRGLILAAAALALLAGVLYWSNRREAAKTAAGGTPEAPRIINLNSDDITRINIQRNQTETIGLVKLDSGDWQVEETPVLPGESGTISSLLSTLAKLDSQRIVQEKPGDLAAYGLAKPAVEANITTKDGKTSKLLLGDNTPAGSSTFAMVANDPRLFTVSSYVKTSLDKPAPDFADKKLFAFGFDFPKKVDMRIDGKSYGITFNGDDWKLGDTKMDATSMQSVIARIRDLEGMRFVATGLGKPVVELTVLAKDGKSTEHVEMSKSGNEYIARRDGHPALYVVSDALITDLQKYVNDMKVYVPPPPETTSSAAPPPPTNTNVTVP
jgi:Domain of unknown function (DUF4340)